MLPSKEVDTSDDLSLGEKQRHERFRALRVQQEKEANRRVTKLDLVLGLAAVFGMRRLLRWLGLSAPKVFLNMGITLLGYAIFKGRHPKRILPMTIGDFPVWPIVGQVLQVRNAVMKGLVGNQLERMRMRDFRTAELVLFGPIRDFGVMDPKDREYILRSNWKQFTKNMPGGLGFQEILAPVLGRGIFAVDGEEWADHRKVSSHLFAANALRHKMETVFAKHGQHLIELLSKHAVSQVIDLQEVMQAFTFETICEIAFGCEPGALEAALIEHEKIEFLVRFDRAQNLCFNRLVLPKFIWKTMRYLNVGYERQLSEDSKELREYVLRIIADRKQKLQMYSSSESNLSETNQAAVATEDKFGDILSMYMRAAKEAKKPYLAEDDYLQDVVLNFMVAGRDTTSSTLINLFRELSGRPEVIEKMLKEMDARLRRETTHGASKTHIGWDHVKELPYSNAVLNETLRMYPPVPGDFRLCNETCELPSGLVIPKGSRVSLLVSAIGRDPHLFQNPDEFIPERWLETEDPANPSCKRIPECVLPIFWGGPRVCLGKDAARLEILCVAQALLSSGIRFHLLPHQDERIKIGPVQFYEEGVKVKVELLSN